VSAEDLDAVLEADAGLCKVALDVDFLLAVTPVDVPQVWKSFHAGGYRTEPTFRYREVSAALPRLRQQLDQVDLDGVDDLVLAEVLANKKKELGTQLDCLEFRNTPRFLESSLSLYGGVDPSLRKLAHVIFEATEQSGRTPSKEADRRIGSRAFAKLAEAELRRYRAVYPGLESKVHVVDDIPGIMASEGDILIGRDVDLPTSRVQPLIQHEVGTHVVTFANGGVHQLQLLRVGLPAYEQTQEAVAVLAEYAVGGLTRVRLVQLAARVVAVDGLQQGAGFTEVFSSLRLHRIPPRAAFQIVARVFRSGGLTKDAIYLRGIAGLLSYLSAGGELNPLFTGKLPIEAVPLLPHLKSRGLISTPPLRPRWAEMPEAQPRLQAARRGLNVIDLIKEDVA
jgi:uncharacterized protein (TIGR02421 family)